MADTTRIDYLLNAMKELDKMLTQHTVPLTIEEKTELLSAHSRSWNTIMHFIPVERKCSSCQHCVFWEDKHCCSAREMRPIPFEVQNNTGGCSKWTEKDYIPFAFAFLTIGGTIAETMLQMWQGSGFSGIL